MKRLMPELLAMLLAAAPMLASGHADHGTPQFGGHVAEAGLFQAELVDGAGMLTIHITQHGAPMATQNGKAVITAQGTAKTISLQLRPSGKNLLVGQGTLANTGAKTATAVISLPGLPDRMLTFTLE